MSVVREMFCGKGVLFVFSVMDGPSYIPRYVLIYTRCLKAPGGFYPMQVRVIDVLAYQENAMQGGQVEIDAKWLFHVAYLAFMQ